MKEELAPMTIPRPLMHEQGAQDTFKLFKSQGFTLKARNKIHNSSHFLYKLMQFTL
jgi:hypothetical protein